ncbi:hypothetical protein IFM61392_04539 [Aspergillus lentulus]|nr:hypothetical protein IFM61392_04539 [Aspergillus lentulus]
MLHISCSGLQSEGSLFDKDGGPVYDSVTVLTGMCLFTRKVLDESVSDGFLDTRRLLGMPPTLYEVEKIAGLSSAIADIAALVFSKYDGKCHVPLNIVLDLPTWHYYESIEDRLQHRGYRPSEVMDWTEAIMLRSQQLAGVLKRAVLHELDRRGVPSTRRLYDIQISPGSSLVDDAFREALKYDKSPCLDDILETLSSSQDGSWRQFYSLLPDREKPHSIKDLSYLFYVFQVARPALLAGIRSGKQPSPTESAYKDSTRSGERHRPASGRRCGRKEDQMPLYTPRRVFIDGNRKGERLYWNDPSPVMPLLSDKKAYGDGGDAEYSKYSRELQQMDFIAKLYGAECADNIQRWSKQAFIRLTSASDSLDELPNSTIAMPSMQHIEAWVSTEAAVSSFAGTLVMVSLYRRCIDHTMSQINHPHAFWEAHYSIDKAINHYRGNLVSHHVNGDLSDDPRSLPLRRNLAAVVITLHETALIKVQKNKLPAFLAAKAITKCIAAATDIAMAVQLGQ